jgi:NAD(P)-dependent dehydrogenase (short-subunit alcohol dehydrogenase family)
MRDAGGGRIVNISSIAGRATAPFAGHYSGAKHALEAMSDALRLDVAGAGVKVVLIEPGGFKTGIWEEFERDIDKREAAGSRYVEAYRRSLQGQKLIEGIMGKPEACAKVIANALTARLPRSRYLVGLDAQAMALGQTFTPTAIKDRLIRLGLGI